MLLQVDKTQVDDLAYCKTAMLGFQSFIAQFEGQSLYTRRDLDFKSVTATITDLIYFVTISDILDPILREGLPHPSRQLLLREQQVLDRAMECIQVTLGRVSNTTAGAAWPALLRSSPRSSSRYSSGTRRRCT